MEIYSLLWIYLPVASYGCWQRTCCPARPQDPQHRADSPRVVNDTAVLEGVLENVAEQYGLSYDNAMDVVNEQGYDYCDRHWDNLVDVGRTARAEITAHGA